MSPPQVGGCAFAKPAFLKSSPLGLSARRVDRAADIAPVLKAAITSGIPNLIDIPISSE